MSDSPVVLDVPMVKMRRRSQAMIKSLRTWRDSDSDFNPVYNSANELLFSYLPALLVVGEVTVSREASRAELLPRVGVLIGLVERSKENVFIPQHVLYMLRSETMMLPTVNLHVISSEHIGPFTNADL